MFSPTGSSDIETLPPVTLSSGLEHSTRPPLKTVTETLSTSEIMIKRSILPVIMGSHTSFYTLSQVEIKGHDHDQEQHPTRHHGQPHLLLHPLTGRVKGT
jgi:hypothetical protein